jgi:hypothetical protein
MVQHILPAVIRQRQKLLIAAVVVSQPLLFIIIAQPKQRLIIAAAVNQKVEDWDLIFTSFHSKIEKGTLIAVSSR